MAVKIHLQLISLRDPCTACGITKNLQLEILDRMAQVNKTVALEEIMLDHPREANRVEGLEVEKFPALLIDGEQISAGSLIPRAQLEQLVQSRLSRKSDTDPSEQRRGEVNE
ncbi:MAG TPA: hypothetical protein VF531_05330 [Bacillota bacterium]